VLNNTSKVLFLAGILTITVLKWWLGYEWLDVIGFTLLFIGLLFSKKAFIENHQSDYGKYIYYTMMVIFMLLVFEKWFL